MRPHLHAFLGVLAILINAVLPAGWQLAFASANPFGETYSICLAGGGVIHEESQPQSAPVAPAESLHCHLCLLPAPAGAAAPGAATAPVPQQATGPVDYRPAAPGLVPSGVADAFDARAPPVWAIS